MNETVLSSFQIWPVTSEKAGNLLANGKCVVAGTIKVNFTIMKGPKGVFASFPSQKVEKPDGVQYYPHMSFIDESTKAMFQTEAVAAYNAAMAAGPVKKPAKTAAVPF